MLFIVVQILSACTFSRIVDCFHYKLLSVWSYIFLFKCPRQEAKTKQQQNKTDCKVLMSQMSQWVMSQWVNESMCKIWKNKSFSRNNKIKYYFYLFCLLPSLLPAQGLSLTWNLDLDLGCLLAVPRPSCRIAEAKNKPA